MNVPIDHYATVDMDGLHDMIDALGGVNVTSNDTFTTKGTNFVKGQSTHVDGDTAMAFIRSRKEEGLWRRFWSSRTTTTYPSSNG